jgi:hypothetical protein
MPDDEIWKSIPGFNGYYEASNHGRIRSVDRTVTTNRIKADGSAVTVRCKGVVRSLDVSPGGYPQVHLSVDGADRVWPVNFLVCAAFHGPRPGKQVAAHNDGMKLNCRPENLRWDTQSGNLADRLKHDTHFRGDRHYNAKLTWADVRKIRASTETHAALAKRYGVYFTTIGKIRRFEKWVDDPLSLRDTSE